MFKKLTLFLSTNILIKAISFISILVVANIISPAELAKLKLLQSIVELVSTFSMLGLTASFLRYYPLYSTPKRELLESTYTFAIIVCGSIFSILAMCLFYNQSFLERLYLIVIPFVALSNIYVYFYQLADKYLLLAKVMSKIKTISLVFVIVMTYFYGFEGYLISNCISLILTQCVLSYVKPIGHRARINDMVNVLTETKDIAKYGFLSTIIVVINANLSIYIVNLVVDDIYMVGIYSYAIIILSVFNVIKNAVQQFVSPILTRESISIVNFESKVSEISRYIFVASSVLVFTFIAIVFAIVSFDIFELGEYSKAYEYLCVLLFSWYLFMLCSTKSVAINSIGKIRYNTAKDFVVLGFGSIILYFTGTVHGIWGVIFSQLLISLLSFLLTNYLFKLAKREYYEDLC